MEISSRNKKPAARVFVNRNIMAEEMLKNRFIEQVSIVNMWIIPLMKQLNIEVTFESVVGYVGENIKSLFIETLIMRDVNEGYILPTKYKQLYTEKEKEFEAALLEVINNSLPIRSQKRDNETAQTLYERKIKECEAIIAQETTLGNEADKYEAQRKLMAYKSSLSRVQSTEKIQDKIKSQVEEFSLLSFKVNLLKNQSGWFKLTDNELCFDEETIIAACAVYAETPQEVELLNELQQLADSMNEIYGANYPGALAAFCTFFEVEKGKVVLKSDIQKDAIERYAKNM